MSLTLAEINKQSSITIESNTRKGTDEKPSVPPELFGLDKFSQCLEIFVNASNMRLNLCNELGDCRSEKPSAVTPVRQPTERRLVSLRNDKTLTLRGWCSMDFI